MPCCFFTCFPTPYCSLKPCSAGGFVLPDSLACLRPLPSHFASTRRTSRFQNYFWFFHEHTGTWRLPQATTRPERHPSPAGPSAAPQLALSPPAPPPCFPPGGQAWKPTRGLQPRLRITAANGSPLPQARATRPAAPAGPTPGPERRPGLGQPPPQARARCPFPHLSAHIPRPRSPFPLQGRQDRAATRSPPPAHPSALASAAAHARCLPRPGVAAGDVRLREARGGARWPLGSGRCCRAAAGHSAPSRHRAPFCRGARRRCGSPLAAPWGHSPSYPLKPGPGGAAGNPWGRAPGLLRLPFAPLTAPTSGKPPAPPKPPMSLPGARFMLIFNQCQEVLSEALCKHLSKWQLCDYIYKLNM